MRGRRVTAVACVVAPTAFLAAQVLLATLPPADGALERITGSPEAWTWSHGLIALSAAGYVLVAVGLVGLCEWSRTATLGLVLVALGSVLAGALVGVDLVIGVLATSAEGDASGVHRTIVERVVMPLDTWSLTTTSGLVLLAAASLTRQALPAPVAAALLVGLAVPALSGLRVLAAAVLLAAFAPVAVAVWRSVPDRSDPRVLPWAALLVCVPYVAVAPLSVQRTLLMLLVVGALVLGLRHNRRATAGA